MLLPIKMLTLEHHLMPKIIAAAKVKIPKNQCYSENWMMLCLLFQISLRLYIFVRTKDFAITLCKCTEKSLITYWQLKLVAVLIMCSLDYPRKIFLIKLIIKNRFTKQSLLENIVNIANGITFYKNKKFSELDDSKKTIQFTLLINDLFDALKIESLNSLRFYLATKETTSVLLSSKMFPPSNSESFSPDRSSKL
ncbi:hypothetical protein AGLY_013875 [Aphis glycines]|uniref:Uncharacterized protein n=1 Tax=Aphis glycines TaxID=307491 RepID=A0A6G0T5C2_APHGL|nr:hypothetical protein AGLY_013875 [Aphis glycines]